MKSNQLARILDQLLHAEQRSIIPRLREFNAFVSWASADEMDAIDGIIAEMGEHVTWLIDAINDLDESPTPYRPDIRNTSMHFCELAALMPMAVEDCRKLVRDCEAAMPAVASDPKAADLIARILTRHQSHLEALEKLSNTVASP